MISALIIQLALHKQPMKCSQQAYDEVYKEITLEAINEPQVCTPIIMTYKKLDGTTFQKPGCQSISEKIRMKRYDAIQALRMICSGKRSSWEQKNS